MTGRVQPRILNVIAFEWEHFARNFVIVQSIVRGDFLVVLVKVHVRLIVVCVRLKDENVIPIYVIIVEHRYSSIKLIHRLNCKFVIFLCFFVLETILSL